MIPELEDMMETIDEDMLRMNQELITHLRKCGVKLREYKWNELQAS